MLKKKIGFFLMACLLALLPAFSSSVSASLADDKRAELDQVQRKMQEMADKKAAAREKAEEASAALSQVTDSLRDLQIESNKLQQQRDALQGKIDDNLAQLEKKQAEVKERQGIYKHRLRDIYINGQVNYLDVLLGAKDFSDFSSRMFLLQRIIKSDVSLMEQMQKDAEEIVARKAQLDGQMQEIKATQNMLQAKTDKVERLRNQRAAMLSEAEAEEQQSQDEYERLLAVSEQIAAMLRNMEQNGTVAEAPVVTNSYIWPCNGVITSPFGWRTHPIFGTTKYHSGLDIGVDYGTPILATNSGTVIYSGWLGGYGNAVMIDHGGGLVSLYAHNDSLNVYEGQYVNRGTCIAYAGSTGYSTGPHCHFEMRLHGEVVDPMGYLP